MERLMSLQQEQRKNQKVSSLVSIMNEALKPPKKISVSDHAEQERYLSRESSSQSGRWKNVGFQKEMQDAVRAGKTVVFMTSSQVGKTETILNSILYNVLCESGGITFLLPSESMATEFSKARISPLIRDTPRLRALIGDARKDGNSVLFRSYPGGYIRLTGPKADKLSSYPSPFLYADEVDRLPRNARNSAGELEGRPLDLLLERMKNWPNRRALLTGTPTIEGVSEIYNWWLKSNQKIPLIKCPHCGHEIYLDFFGFFNRPDWGQFEWKGMHEGEELDLESIHYVCGKCENSFKDHDLDRWKLEPNWLSLNPESSIEGFHINAFYSPWTKWSELLAKILDAGKNPVRLQVVKNTTAGIPANFEQIRVPSWEILANRKHEYQRYEIPEKVKILLAACDVQMDRLEVSLYGFYKKQAFLITHEIFHGNTANIDDPVWQDLDEFINRRWKREDGIEMPVSKCAIDAHYNTNQVGHFVHRRSKFVPVTGLDNGWKTELMSARPLEIKHNGKYLKTSKRRWNLGVSLIKMDLYSRLLLEVNEKGEYPSEYIHFPSGMPDEFYKQLTGEVCKLEEDAQGNPRSLWEQRYQQVECLDTAVYVLALYRIAGLHTWSDEKWEGIKK